MSASPFGFFGIIGERSRGCSSVVERVLPKHDIVGSNPITRSVNRVANKAARFFYWHLLVVDQFSMAKHRQFASRQVLPFFVCQRLRGYYYSSQVR